MGFCISNVYHELSVKSVWWSDDNHETELAVVCHDITYTTQLKEANDVKADLTDEGWKVNKS